MEPVRVPRLVGLAAEAAHDAALDAGVLAVDQDPSHTATMDGTVVRQQPMPGREVKVGTSVLIWVRTDSDGGGGGGGGSRLPTGPRPLLPAGTK
ncbi:hypothetical protein PA7_20210 [Pseudonocardia asaccharolytica DSM 44247 = NBRC 16224]|uniref:PASTA domain-containing protein n=2 Tax=Pseudonocardia asaccharolytica TaxID=54010 RepID=A0A511D3K9_9PSEU|nr:hypothetical protein PA7_20210 [Pseudonocardia asaccharolytica DSM 44247 = NBRC 16224]